jgi:hypothetical protein
VSGRDLGGAVEGAWTQGARARDYLLRDEAAVFVTVFINDLRVLSETADNAAVLLHYLTWRARLPLGERVTVMDELDLWVGVRGSFPIWYAAGGELDAYLVA